MKFSNNVFGNAGCFVEAFLRVCEAEKFRGRNVFVIRFLLLLLLYAGFIRDYVRDAVRHACRSPYHVIVFIFVQFKILEYVDKLM
jgi:hypothetical protein